MLVGYWQLFVHTNSSIAVAFTGFTIHLTSLMINLLTYSKIYHFSRDSVTHNMYNNKDYRSMTSVIYPHTSANMSLFFRNYQFLVINMNLFCFLID